MKYSAFALAATAVASMADAQVKWAPLNAVKAGTVNEPAQATATTAPPAAAQKAAPPVAPEPVATVVPQPAAATVPAPMAGGAQLPLQITCFGGGTANKAASATAWSSGSFSGNAGSTWISGTTSGTTTVFGTRQQGFGDQVDIRLFSGDDRIRLPRTMLPPIHGGEAGWFKLKNVVADARSIRASAAINFMSNPKVYIDRVTGTISISGRAGDYSGQCQAIQGDAPAKF